MYQYEKKDNVRVVLGCARRQELHVHYTSFDRHGYLIFYGDLAILSMCLLPPLIHCSRLVDNKGALVRSHGYGSTCRIDGEKWTRSIKA
jgi:hypothetical protein